MRIEDCKTARLVQPWLGAGSAGCATFFLLQEHVMRHIPVAIALALSAAFTLSACGEKEKPNAAERAVERAKDALNLRENEEIKDAMEDLQSAGENAAKAAEKEAEEMKKKLEDDDR
jgi:Skp family chaperone for outer membrane proteins